MDNPTIISLLCIGIAIGNVIWCFIADEGFPESMQRAFFMIFGALMAYFVII